MMIYFYQNKFVHTYFSKIVQTFYDLLFTRNNSELLQPLIFFLAINFFSLINGKVVLFYHNRPCCLI